MSASVGTLFSVMGISYITHALSPQPFLLPGSFRYMKSLVLGSDAASTSQSASAGSVGSNVQASSKYRAYATAVDKALKSFESTTEWADLISALGKLCKVLQANSKNFNDVPKSVTVAKRLSQCLHPALPSGLSCLANLGH